MSSNQKHQYTEEKPEEMYSFVRPKVDIRTEKKQIILQEILKNRRNRRYIFFSLPAWHWIGFGSLASLSILSCFALLPYIFPVKQEVQPLPLEKQYISSVTDYDLNIDDGVVEDISGVSSDPETARSSENVANITHELNEVVRDVALLDVDRIVMQVESQKNQKQGSFPVDTSLASSRSLASSDDIGGMQKVASNSSETSESDIPGKEPVLAMAFSLPVPSVESFESEMNIDVEVDSILQEIEQIVEKFIFEYENKENMR